jgi:gamma-glutamylcyclotransferase (GGCT)/AIG2-like uncharacterized protein YtfP
MPHYFAFGCNLDLGQFYQRCPTARTVDRAMIEGYQLVFPLRCPHWQGGVASLAPAPRHWVEGALYEVSESELLALDTYEDVAGGDYRRETIEAATENHGRMVVWTYLANPDPKGPSAPSAAYRDAVVRGALEHGLSADYVEMLRQLRVCDEGEK